LSKQLKEEQGIAKPVPISKDWQLMLRKL
jgi:hypothetical protein